MLGREGEERLKTWALVSKKINGKHVILTKFISVLTRKKVCSFRNSQKLEGAILSLGPQQYTNYTFGTPKINGNILIIMCMVLRIIRKPLL